MSNKILVVDDSPADLQNIKSIVSNAGHTVITASSGKEAVMKAKEMHPDMIFMDVIMDNTGGFEACREIISDRDTKDIPVVLLVRNVKKQIVSGQNCKEEKLWLGSHILKMRLSVRLTHLVN